MVISLEKYKEKKRLEKTVALGNKIVWHDPIFDSYFNSTILNIWDKEKNEVKVADLSEKDNGYSLQLEDGMIIVSDLFKKKMVS